MHNNMVLIFGALQKFHKDGREPQLLFIVEEKKIMEVSERWW